MQSTQESSTNNQGALHPVFTTPIIVLCLIASHGTANAWGGPNDNTHKFITEQALQILANDNKQTPFPLHVTDLLTEYSVDPDYSERDIECHEVCMPKCGTTCTPTYKGHFYHYITGTNWRGGVFPTAKTRAVEHYNAALAKFLLGNHEEAWQELGRSLHYIEDATNMHHARNEIAFFAPHSEFETWTGNDLNANRGLYEKQSSSQYNTILMSSIGDIVAACASFAAQDTIPATPDAIIGYRPSAIRELGYAQEVSAAVIYKFLVEAHGVDPDSAWRHVDAWTGWTTDGRDSVSCGDDRLAVGVGCRGRYCDDVRLMCRESNNRPHGGGWSQYFSDEDNDEFICPYNGFVTGLKCDGRYCDNVSLKCSLMDPEVTRSDCSWRLSVSEEGPGALVVSEPYFLAGMFCWGDYCDTKALYVCKQSRKESRYPMVRIRHKVSGQCQYSNRGNGGWVYHHSCWDDPNMAFEIIQTASQKVRLRHVFSDQCSYVAGNFNGASLAHWGCWDDPNMEFELIPIGSDHYRIRHVLTGRCLYSNGGNGGQIGAWDCWDDPNMVWSLDPVH